MPWGSRWKPGLSLENTVYPDQMDPYDVISYHVLSLFKITLPKSTQQIR